MKRKPWFVCGSISTLAAALFIAVYAPGRMKTRFDDAYMFSRYADNSLNGHGFAWNPTHGPSYGTASPVYLILITALKATPPPLFINSILLSLVSFSLFLLGVGFSIKTGFVLSGALARNGIPLLVLPLCLLAPMCRYHPFTGMDTTLAFTANAFLCQGGRFSAGLFRRDYLYYPGVFNYGIALGKGSPLFETILEELIDYSTSSEG